MREKALLIAGYCSSSGRLVSVLDTSSCFRLTALLSPSCHATNAGRELQEQAHPNDLRVSSARPCQPGLLQVQWQISGAGGNVVVKSLSCQQSLV